MSFMPNLSSRPRLYSLSYAWQGVKELSNSPYELPNDTEYLLVNFEDILTYQAQYQKKRKYKIAI